MESLVDIQKGGVSAFTLGGGGSAAVDQVTVDFGATPVFAASVVIALTGATVGEKVVMTAAGDTPAGVDADELEMDGFLCAAAVTATNQITARIHAVPGPVTGTRKFNLLRG